jgi:hypothetical protein
MVYRPAELRSWNTSHDTLGDVFAVIDTEQFSECFSNWVADLSNLVEEEVIALDGKCLRRSIDNASNKAAIYMVSAWSQQNSLVLGQVKVDDKSNEITAIPELLCRLDIAGAVIKKGDRRKSERVSKTALEKLFLQRWHVELDLRNNLQRCRTRLLKNGRAIRWIFAIHSVSGAGDITSLLSVATNVAILRVGKNSSFI